jgi:hypothetical protein
MTSIQRDVAPASHKTAAPSLSEKFSSDSRALKTQNMAATLKRMTLADARAELERQGFTVFSDQESPRRQLVSGVLSNFRWRFMARFDVMVFVHQVSGGNLTYPRILEDLRELPNRVEDLDPGGCPPFGVSRGRMILLVYLVDHAIDPDALNRIVAAPKSEWCSSTFLAAQDGEGKSHYMEGNTPLWGRALYPEKRYWAGRMTGRALPETPPAAPSFLMWINAFLVIYLVLLFFQNPRLMLSISIPAILLFVVAGLFQYCRARRRPTRGSRLGGRGIAENASFFPSESRQNFI